MKWNETNGYHPVEMSLPHLPTLLATPRDIYIPTPRVCLGVEDSEISKVDNIALLGGHQQHYRAF